jgi:hypothetical protein
LHERNPAQISRGDKTRQITHHTATQRDDERFPFETVLREMLVTMLNGSQTLRGFTRRQSDPDALKSGRGKIFFRSFAVVPRDVAIGDNSAALAQAQSLAILAQLRQQTCGN